MNEKYKRAIKRINKAFNPKGIKFVDASEGWKEYKKKVKEKNENR